ncbi:hypothetical protein [Blastococcus sp. VKM Ac-2987]|uniref:hypothetical protein n=1 Tax=Blastococcus sp. VKM Ac-2987 TaxID=3004141 RepID=UPI0022ABB0DB|nr:hypothetical protein [Blastococcus sp. VKM Ac-2987]MCZ2857808.1 hypothetical protein [Blastococcus sp. VKM Ac-2987]
MWDRLLKQATPERIHAREVNRYRWAWWLSWLLPLLGVAVVALWAYGTATTAPEFWALVAALLLVAAAALAVGGLLGFLFGVPKVLSEGGSTETTTAPAAPGVQGTVTNAVRGGVTANTNLEQISDWLTKILVGVGLVQIAQAPGAFGRLVSSISGAFDLANADHVIGSLLLFFAIVGFLDAYLLTRLSLTGAFSAALTDGPPAADSRK